MSTGAGVVQFYFAGRAHLQVSWWRDTCGLPNLDSRPILSVVDCTL